MTQLKAYEVREPDEGHCTVIFAEKNVVARREGAAELNCEFEEVESCTRVPEFDVFAPGPVPLSAMLAKGWWFTCAGCGCEFDGDGIRGHDGDEETAPEIDPVEDGKHSAFCTQECMMSSWAKARLNKALESAAVEECLARWPQATHVHPQRSNCDVDVPDTCVIRLPGLKYSVKWKRGGSSMSVTECDVQEFKRLYGAPQPSASSQAVAA